MAGGYLQGGTSAPTRAIVSIGAVDAENRLASGTFADGAECGNIINTRNQVGAVQVTPAVGEQWIVELQGTQWALITQLPIHTPQLDGTTRPEAGQVQIGSSGPLELFGSTINAHADITIPEGNQLILNGVQFRTEGGVFQYSNDGGTTWTNVAATSDIPDGLTNTDDLPEGTTNLYFKPERAPVQSVAGKTGIVVLDNTDVGLGNVSNLAPLDLPLSTATTGALGGKADLISGTVPINQIPTGIPADNVTGLPATNDNVQGIFDIFKGTSGGGLADIASRIINLNPLTGLFNAAGLTNTANLPVLNQDRVFGLSSLAGLVGGQGGLLQDILNAFSGGSGGIVANIISRIANLDPFGLLNAAGLTNTSNLPVLNQDRVNGLPGLFGQSQGIIDLIFNAWAGFGDPTASTNNPLASVFTSILGIFGIGSTAQAQNVVQDIQISSLLDPSSNAFSDDFNGVATTMNLDPTKWHMVTFGNGFGDWVLSGAGEATWNEQGGVVRGFRCRYIPQVTLTDTQLVLFNMMADLSGAATAFPYLSLLGRMNSAADEAIFGLFAVEARIDHDSVEIGYWAAGSYVRLGTEAAYTENTSGVWRFKLGTTNSSREFQLFHNDQLTISRTDTLGQSFLGDHNRYVGHVAYSGNGLIAPFFSVQVMPPNLGSWGASDRGAAA